MAIELQAIAQARPSSTATVTRGITSRGPRISAKERVFFTERLVLLLQTGNALHPSLATLAKQAESPAMRTILKALHDDVGSGQTFAAALERHPSVFEPAYVNLVDAGERGGFMATALEQLIAHDQRMADLRNTIVAAFTYPAVLCVFSLAVVIFVLAVVFPKFAEMFVLIKDQLPVSTLILMALSDAIVNHSMVVSAGAAGLVLASVYGATQPSVRAWVDSLKLRLPGCRGLYVEFYLTQTFWILGVSLDQGVSVPDALKACRELTGNARFKALIEEVESDVQEGRGLSAAFVRQSFIPDLARQMVVTGEESGTLGMVLTRTAEHYQRELGRRLKAFSKLAEPLLLLVMGVVVGVLVASLILPIFKLSRAVQ